MAVRFTILVLLTTVVVVVSSAGLLGEQWITLSCFFSIFLFFFLFFFFFSSLLISEREGRKRRIFVDRVVFDRSVRFVTRWNKQSFNVSHINRDLVPGDIPFGDDSNVFFRT